MSIGLGLTSNEHVALTALPPAVARPRTSCFVMMRCSESAFSVNPNRMPLLHLLVVEAPVGDDAEDDLSGRACGRSDHAVRPLPASFLAPGSRHGWRKEDDSRQEFKTAEPHQNPRQNQPAVWHGGPGDRRPELTHRGTGVAQRACRHANDGQDVEVLAHRAMIRARSKEAPAKRRIQTSNMPTISSTCSCSTARRSFERCGCASGA